LAYLQLGRAKEDKQSHRIKVCNFAVSQNHEFLAIYTSDNCLLTYKIADIVFKEQQNNRMDQFGGFIDDQNVGNEVIMDAINSD
jgi:hypothetical protein